MYDNQSIHSPIKATYYILLLLLSRFSRVRLYATPQTAAHQAPPSLGFSRQEHWSGLPFPSPMMKVKSESEVSQLCPTRRDPKDCSLPGSSIQGIFPGKSTGVGCQCLLWLYLSCFQVLTIVNEAAINIHVKVLCRHKFFIHLSTVTGFSSAVRVFLFVKNWQSVFQRSSTILHSHLE